MIKPATYLIFIILFSIKVSMAQNVGINTDGSVPENSSVLELKAANRGFLMVRADTINIVAPVLGLMTLSPVDSCLYMYSGNKWMGLGGAGCCCPISGAPTGYLFDVNKFFPVSEEKQNYFVQR